MAAPSAPEPRHSDGDFNNALHVLFSIAIGLALILVHVVVLGFEKCAAGYTTLRGKFGRAHTSAAPAASIEHPVSHRGDSVSSVTH